MFTPPLHTVAHSCNPNTRSLQRIFKSSRPLLNSLTVAIVTAIATQAAGASVLEDNYTFTGSEVLEGINATGGKDIIVTGNTITFRGTNPVIFVQTDGRPNTTDLSTVVIGTAETDTVSITSSNNWALRTNGGDLTINGRNIAVSAGSGEAIRLGGYGTTNIGGEETEFLTISNSNGDGLVILPYQVNGSSVAQSDAKVNLKSDVIDINVSDYAIWVQNNSTGYEGHYADLTIDANELHLTADTGIVTMSQGSVTINADTYINALSDAIVTRGGSKTIINPDETHVVQIRGDVTFNFDKATSNTGVDADVTINLSGEESFWEGNSTVSWGSGKPDDESKLIVENFTLSLSNGAQWIATTPSQSDNSESGVLYTPLNKLVLNNGVVTLANTDTSVIIEDLRGSGGTFNVTTSATEEGFAHGKIQIDNATPDTVLTVGLTGVTADDIRTVEVLSKITDATVTGNAKLAQIRTVAEGDILGTITETIDADGNRTGSSIAKNTKLDSFEGVNAATLMQWRNEINHLTKRLGDIRGQTETMGAWARIYGSENAYSDVVDVEVEHTTVQVGLDGRMGNWIVGGAFSYTNSEADITNGTSEGDGYTFSVYGTRFFDSGAYIDTIVRYGRLSTDVDVADMKGSFDNNAFSVSAELGHNFKFLQRAFVEPQVGVTYGFVSGDSFSPKQGIKIEQDDFQMLIARLGARAGWHFDNNAGQFYAQAFVNHDFLGDADGEATNGEISQDLNVDLGGTWVSYGLGLQIQPTNSTAFYGELGRSTGGEVKDHYTFNVGVRYAW